MFLHLQIIATSLYCFQLAMNSVFWPSHKHFGHFDLDWMAIAYSSILSAITYWWGME